MQIPRRSGLRVFMAVLLCPWLLGASDSSLSLFESVSAPVRSFDPQRGEQAQIRFEIRERCDVFLRIYDGRDWLVREVRRRSLDPGGHTLGWDGRDDQGRAVPPEAYRYTLEADSAAGTQIWDLGDATGGDPMRVDAVEWDPDRGTIRYLLPRPGRVRIRLGLDRGGPLLHTLLDWVPRSSGLHEVAWGGRDRSGLLDLARHSGLRIAAEAFALSDNTLFVGPPPDRVRLLEGLDPQRRRPRQRTPRRRMRDYAEQAIEERADFPVDMQVVEPELSSGGRPLVRGMTRIEIDVEPRARDRLLGQRVEVVYFVDGEVLFENEIGFLPVTWHLNADALGPGVHYLTTNLRGYEGHFGIATIAVEVPDPSSSAASPRARPTAATAPAKGENSQ